MDYEAYGGFMYASSEKSMPKRWRIVPGFSDAFCAGFIDGAFCVDGVLTDLAITSQAAIGCFSNLNNTKTDHAGVPLVISNNGASGDYPDCTDLAFQKAVDDGADVIDCAVQVTKDGIPICMSSIDLKDVSTVVTSQFASLAVVIEDIKPVAGVYTFNLTWEDITDNLKPMISNPWSSFSLSRNPRNRNAGNFMRLSDFLAFAKRKDLSGIMLTVEHASFMAEKLGFGVVDAVIKALDDSGYSKQTAQKVMIQSTNSSVLVKFKEEFRDRTEPLMCQCYLYEAEEDKTDLQAAIIEQNRVNKEIIMC